MVLNSQWVNGATTKKFQQKAMGIFFRNVPIKQINILVIGRPPKIILNRIVAIKLIKGHIILTVKNCLASRQV